VGCTGKPELEYLGWNKTWRMANGEWRMANGVGSEKMAYFCLFSRVVFTNNTVDIIYYSCHKLNSIR
jgi:hypothetical protein